MSQSHQQTPNNDDNIPAAAPPLKKKVTNEKGDGMRELYFGNSVMNKPFKFTNNFIKTSRYTGLSFFPKCLLLQFKRYANIYFLVIAILQSIPLISPLNAFSAVAPLVFVLALSMAREGYEDVVRHRSDEEKNSSKCIVYRDGQFKESVWKDIEVGDFVKVHDMEFFPADLIVIQSSNENGICFIETSSLDGEKNLKPKNASKDTLSWVPEENSVIRVEGRMKCDQPNAELYEFKGHMITPNQDTVILSAKQLMLRGAKLKNTEWVIGIACYTGIDTKVMKNSEAGRNKQSNIERLTNKLIMQILGFQIFLCLASAFGCFAWDFTNLWANSHYLYLSSPYPSGLDGFISFWSYFLLNNTMIPISLIVSLELVKLCQAYFIEKDLDIYNVEKERYAKVFTSSINEELGQVEYIFSDKTGTLTCNRMEFKICIIGDEMFGDASLIMNPGETLKKKITHTDKKGEVDFSFHDSNLVSYLTDANRKGKTLNLDIKSGDQQRSLHRYQTQQELIKDYLLLLATCHDCLAEKNKETGNLTYQGPSPDEITLVDAACRLGYKYIGGSQSIKKIDIMGEVKDIELLYAFEFDSDRKRMSVIIRHQGVIKMFIKGADSIVISRLNTNVEQPFLKNIQEKLNEFSKRGLRTLCIAMKVVEEKEFAEFDRRYKEVAVLPDRDPQIAKLADAFERGLYLIGATAVEDKLQDNVPETIYDLIKANIKVWMLTGDKLETAENIGRSCNLVQPEFKVMTITGTCDVKSTLEAHLITYNDLVKQGKQKAVLIEGDALTKTMANEEIKAMFLKITKGCEAVICCRVTPKQKAQVVRLVKDNLNKITLAIGDGANDVNMIQEAHIGIGIYGQEGMRAVQSSDYAIPEFQGLWKLLFVHGRWSYIRISEMILYFFYKNMLFTIPQFYFSFVCAFSGQSVFDDWYITFYNMIFTALPLVIRAIVEQDIYYKQREPEEPQKGPIKKNGEIYQPIFGVRPLIKKYYPALYKIGQQNEIFNVKTFYLSAMQGMIHAILIFCVTYYAMPFTGLNAQGHTSDMWYFSITMYTSVILIVDIKLAAYTRYWTILSGLALVITSIGFYFAYIWIADAVSSFQVYQTATSMFSSQQFYLSVILTVGFVFILDITYMYLQTEYNTSILQLFWKIVTLKRENDEEVFEEWIDNKKPGERKKTGGIVAPDQELEDLKNPVSNTETSAMKHEDHGFDHKLEFTPTTSTKLIKSPKFAAAGNDNINGKTYAAKKATEEPKISYK